MLVEIDLSKQDKHNHINFAPKDTLSEVIQNIQNIVLLTKGSVPYQRDIGLDENAIDLPIDKAVMLFKMELSKQIKKFEPRAKVIKFNWSDSDLTNGYLKVKVTISINERLL